MHPGLPTMPLQNNAGWGQDRGYGQQQSQQEDPRQPHGNYAAPALAGGATGAAAGYGTSHLAPQPSFTPPGNMGMYGHHAAGYGGQSTPPAEAYAPGFIDETGRASPFVPYRHNVNSQASYNSQDPLTSTASAPGMAAHPAAHGNGGYYDRTPSPSRYSPPQPPLAQPQPPYSDSPAQSHTLSREHLDDMVFLDPQSVADDGDDGLGPVEDPRRASKISFGRMSKNSSNPNVAAAPAAAGAVAGGAAATGVLHKVNSGGDYASAPGGGVGDDVAEKTAWLKDNEASSRAWKKWLFIGLGILILLAIAGGTVGGILGTRKSSKSSGGSSSQSGSDPGNGHDLSLNSQQVQALMNNKNLHKVFSGMAYTPFNTQYPACLTNPPLQNNVTLDMAVLSQITNVVRLYGTDCNQTQMVLHAIDQLKLTDMKVWLGVWLGNNQTTNDRQMAQMWDIINDPTYGTKYLKGVVIGNEVLFRKDLTMTELGTILTGVKSNLTSKNINLPVATSDLGDNWTQQLAEQVDVVMSNVHPFFGGVAVDKAAAWTWTFWQQHDVILTNGMTGKSNLISEVGWPSQGGNDCAPSDTCPDTTSGAVAGIDNMNKFMDDWVCQTMANGTDYFWYVHSVTVPGDKTC
jgi:exo-beta-1,3-glucanase (GH17 family)